MICKAEDKQEEYRRCFLTEVKSYDMGIPLYVEQANGIAGSCEGLYQHNYLRSLFKRNR